MTHVSTHADEEIRRLLSRLDDLCDRAGRGESAVSRFLTPREARYASRHLSARMRAGTACLFGGYTDAERVRAIILPDYVEGMTDPEALASDPITALSEAGLEDIAALVRESAKPILIQGSGYRELSHRDYLGSVLGLSLERDAIGDILVTDAHSAYLITGAQMGDFLVANLQKVATDTVKVSCPPEGTVLSSARRLAPISDTVASERLDCVVAALCSLSRDKAQTAIRAGLCELDYEPVEECDVTVTPPAVISVRGYGKFAVHSFDGATRKGRIRLSAGKYL